MIAIQQHPALWQPQVSIDYRTPGEFLYREEPCLQHFFIDSSVAGSLLTEGGSLLTYPADAFMSKEDKKRVFGKVELVLKELYTPTDILLYGRPTTSNGVLLETAVQFQIRAFQNGQPLELALSLQISIPASRLGKKPGHLSLFSGGVSDIRTITGQRTFDWKYASGLLFKNAGSEYWHLRVGRCGWWACQKACNPKAKRTMLSARAIGIPFGSRQFDGLLLFRDIPAMVRMYPGVHGFTALNVPEGLSVSVLIFGNHHEQLYAGRSTWESSSGRLFTLSAEPVRREDFCNMLMG